MNFNSCAFMAGFYTNYHQKVNFRVIPKHDESNIPKAKQFLDVGTKTGVMFPIYEFKPFMNASDLFVRKVLSDENFITYGKNILEVAKTLTQNNLQL